jgi:putative transcriptional regulator
MGERKLKIADVAKATNIHRNMISLLYYEKAKRIDFETIEKLCRFFQCRIEELFEVV